MRQLATAGDQPSPSLLGDILAYDQDAVPALCDALNAANRHDAPWSLAEFSTMLLGKLRAPAAVPHIVASFYLPEDYMGDMLWELPALRSIGVPAIEPLLSVTADDSLEHYPRALAWETLADIALEHEEERAGILAAFRAELQRRIAAEPTSDDDVDMIGTMVNLLADFADPEAYDLILSAYRRDLVDPTFVTLEIVDEAYAKGVNRRLPYNADAWYSKYLNGFASGRRPQEEE